MPTIVHQDGYSIYVQFSDHPEPHCHVWRGGEELAIVSLVTLRPRFPWHRVTRQIRELIKEHHEALWIAFNEHNPPR